MAHWLDVLFAELVAKDALFPDGWGDVSAFRDLRGSG